MYIAIIASDNKKELMAQFCFAYSGILGKHKLCATQVTGKYISDYTGLVIEQLMSGHGGGAEQIASRGADDEIDLILYFRDTERYQFSESENAILRLCDIHNVPVATNLATAEVMVMALQRGDLDFREYINPKSEYKQSKKEQKR